MGFATILVYHHPVYIHIGRSRQIHMWSID